jgi:FlaG/FlaF family flagellin (archaellin)
MFDTDLTRDDRAVSTAISHVLTIGITAVLITGLVIGTSGFVQTERDRTTQREMVVVGERMADELEQLDGLVANPDDTVRVRTSHPQRIAGSAYTVTLTDSSSRCDGDAPCLVLSADDAGARVVVSVNVANAVTESTVSGGRLAFVYDSTDDLHIEPRGDV